jgi:hypothetical protein
MRKKKTCKTCLNNQAWDLIHAIQCCPDLSELVLLADTLLTAVLSRIFGAKGEKF